MFSVLYLVHLHHIIFGNMSDRCLVRQKVDFYFTFYIFVCVKFFFVIFTLSSHSISFSLIHSDNIVLFTVFLHLLNCVFIFLKAKSIFLFFINFFISFCICYIPFYFFFLLFSIVNFNFFFTITIISIFIFPSLIRQFVVFFRLSYLFHVFYESIYIYI